MLLERKVDGDRRDEHDLTALMLAAKADRLDAVEALVNIADVEMLATDARGQTALHMAARVGSCKTLKALLKCGHDVRVMDHDGNQAIHAACRGGDVATIETLVAYDAPLGCRNWAGFTPIGVARMCGRRAAFRYLEDTIAPETMGVFEVKDYDGGVDAEVAADAERRRAALADEAAGGGGDTTPEAPKPYFDKQVGRWVFPEAPAPPEPERPRTAEEEADDAVALPKWDLPVSERADKWVRGWSGEEGFSDIVWTHAETGEVRALPPPDTAQHVRDLCRQAWPKTVLKRQLVITKDDDGDAIEVGAAEYEHDRKRHDAEVDQLKREHAAATVLQTIWRRLDAIFMARLLRDRRRGARGMQRLVRWRQWEDRRREAIRQNAAATLLSKHFRGRDARRTWANFLHELLWWRRAERRLGVKMQRLFRGHVSRRFLRRARCMKYGPQRFEAWALVVQESGEPHRKYGIWEERRYPRRFAHPKDCENIAALGPLFRDVMFYYNRVTGRCVWDIPSDWQVYDKKCFEEREETRRQGFTKQEAAAASTLQAIWKGRRDRMNLKATIQGAKLMRSCEDEYLMDPRNLRKMTYYVLYLHAMKKDAARARPLYQHCMTRMRDRGPDDAWVLISYAIFNAATGDDDWPVIDDCAHRGRVAPEGPLHGNRRGYDLADGGFFRAATAADPCGWTWHNYALCRWLAFQDNKGAERAFVRAIQYSPHNKLIQDNFDFFLKRAYPGKEDEINAYDVVREEATKAMFKELEYEEKKRERMRNDPKVQAATMRIQMCWRRRQFFQEILGRDYFKNKREAEEKERQRAIDAGEIEEDDDLPEDDYDDDDRSDSSSDAESVESVDSEEERLRGKQVKRWEENADASGRIYWYDTVRGLSVWNKPDDLDEVVYIGKDGNEIVIPEEVDEEDEDPRLHPEYEEHVEGDYTFYYHVPTGTSTWVRPKFPSPEELKLMQEANEMARPAGVHVDEWEAHRDENGQMYFYNVDTGMSQWTHPGTNAIVKFDHNEENALVIT